MERSRIVSKQPRGRPRSAAADQAILAAAIALVRKVGYEAVTMEGVAAQAGVGKATLYRRWDGKEALVAEAVGGIVGGIAIADAGSARKELTALMRATVALYRDPATRELLAGLVAAMARSRRIARAVREGFVRRWSDTLAQVLARGIARGELAADIDIDLAVDLLGGAFSNRALVTGRPIDEAMAQKLAYFALKALGRT